MRGVIRDKTLDKKFTCLFHFLIVIQFPFVSSVHRSLSKAETSFIFRASIFICEVDICGCVGIRNCVWINKQNNFLRIVYVIQLMSCLPNRVELYLTLSWSSKYIRSKYIMYFLQPCKKCDFKNTHQNPRFHRVCPNLHDNQLCAWLSPKNSKRTR